MKKLPDKAAKECRKFPESKGTATGKMKKAFLTVHDDGVACFIMAAPSIEELSVAWERVDSGYALDVSMVHECWISPAKQFAPEKKVSKR